jgi:hypothetical protein
MSLIQINGQYIDPVDLANYDREPDTSEEKVSEQNFLSLVSIKGTEHKSIQDLEFNEEDSILKVYVDTKFENNIADCADELSQWVNKIQSYWYINCQYLSMFRPTNKDDFVEMKFELTYL